MRARLSSRGRRSPSEPSRRGIVRPHVGPVGAGLLAVLAGFPVLAQVGAFPPAEPAQEERLPPLGTEPAPDPAPPADAPAVPASPFGISPDIFPGIFGRPDRRTPEAPVIAPAPGVPPAPTGAPAAPDSPFGISPEIFPGIFSRPDQPPREQPDAPAEPGVVTAPTAPGPDGVVAPEPLAPPFLTPPFGFGGIPPSPFLPLQPAPPVATAAPLPTRLAPLLPGALPVQAFDHRAPPILIRPNLSAFGGYDSNSRSVPNGFSDAYARLNGNTAISFDTVRLQGQLSGGLDYLKYARATNQDRLNVNLLAYGLGTVVQDHIFIDGRAAITQTSQTGGFAFADPTLIRQNDLTQVMTASVTPIARQSFGGYVDGELRYNYGIVRNIGGGLFGGSDGAPAATNLNDATSNAGTLSLATGRLFTVFGSRLTLDARKIDSQSASRSTQLRVYDDVSYQFNQSFAALARVGYENLDYPLQPGASFNGAAWAVGGRYTPFPGSHFIGSYGRQEGLTGFSGALRYEVTARTVALASFQRNRTSQQQQILNNLNASAVDPYGNVVDQVSGVPTYLVNPAFFLTNTVSEYETARAGLQTQLERDTFGLFGYLERRTPLGTPIGTAAATAVSEDTGGGVNFSWSRSLTPRLNSRAVLGFARQTTGDQNTLTASLSMTYLLAERLTAVLNYRFIDVDTAAVGGSYRRNQVEIGLRRSF